jgi:hypothetical protein
MEGLLLLLPKAIGFFYCGKSMVEVFGHASKFPNHVFK